MILVLDEESQNVLTQFVVIGGHVVLRMGEQPWLEDGRKIGRGHEVLVRLGGKDSQEIENVE